MDGLNSKNKDIQDGGSPHTQSQGCNKFGFFLCLVPLFRKVLEFF